MFSPILYSFPPPRPHIISFAVQKILNLTGTIDLFLLLFLLPWDTDLRKYFYNLCQRILHLYSWRLLVSCLIFRFLSHFEFLCMVWENVLISLIYESCPDFSTPHVEKALFSILYSCFLCHRLCDYISVDLFLGSLFYFINLYICCAGILLFCIL